MNKELRATEIAHLILASFLQKGDRAIDATAGNGYDTLFLAQQVGREGLVYAFDIQEEAIKKTQLILEKHGCGNQVQLIHESHEHLISYVRGKVRAIVFNLGYLPGGSKEIITQGAATLLSLQAGLEILEEGGVISVVVYPGHPGGKEEGQLLENMLTSLPCPPWHVLSWKRINGESQAPYLLVVQRGNELRRMSLENKTT